MCGGGRPDSKDTEEPFLLWYGHFSSKIWEMNKTETLPMNIGLYKIRFKKSSLMESKNTRGVKAVWKKPKQKQIFLEDGFPRGSLKGSVLSVVKPQVTIEFTVLCSASTSVQASKARNLPIR